MGFLRPRRLMSREWPRGVRASFPKRDFNASHGPHHPAMVDLSRRKHLYTMSIQWLLLLPAYGMTVTVQKVVFSFQLDAPAVPASTLTWHSPSRLAFVFRVIARSLDHLRILLPCFTVTESNLLRKVVTVVSATWVD